MFAPTVRLGGLRVDGWLRLDRLRVDGWFRLGLDCVRMYNGDG